MPIRAFVLFLIVLSGCTRTSPPVYQGTKIRGINTVAPSEPIDSAAFAPIRNINAEWVAVIPYGFCREGEPRFYFNMERQWWGESLKGTAETIKLAHQNGLKVMLKPHAWVGRGTYTGDLDFKSETEWQAFEKDFGAYILANAHLADSMKVELFCIATEMDNFVRKRASFWRSIIKQTRQIYHGALTYADNWNHYHRNPFWADLDYIGVDAYFPLSSEKHPSVETLQKGWKTHLEGLEELAATLQKPVLFTELGYRSVDFATTKPWESYQESPQNHELQADAYRAFFREVWDKQWLVGMFAWKWFLHRPRRFHGDRDSYSPQDKPAEQVLKLEFGKADLDIKPK